MNDQTEMDENLNITIPKTNLAAIYKLTDGHLTPSPVKNHSRVPPSVGTSSNTRTKDWNFLKNTFQNIPLTCILLFLINTASRFLKKSQIFFWNFRTRKNFKIWNWSFGHIFGYPYLDIRIGFFTGLVRGKKSIQGPFGRSTCGQDSLKPRKVPSMVHTSKSGTSKTAE